MVAKNLDRTRKHPAIVWIHGSGSDQNYLGWHPGSYRMYYSASLYLAQQGYVVITPDYRGSSGYSRDWATGVHMGLGVSDATDVASSADYLKTLNYVDPDRIGVWGLSYGGYLTLQALTRDPIAVPLRHQRGRRRRLGDLRRGLHDAAAWHAGRESRDLPSVCADLSPATNSPARCWSCTAPMIATWHSAIRCGCGISCSSSGRTSKWVSIRAKFISSAARTFSATPGGGQKTSSIVI